MKNVKKVVDLAKEIIKEYDEKYSVAPNKSSSARLRKSMNELKKAVTDAKNETLAADKAGYAEASK